MSTSKPKYDVGNYHSVNKIETCNTQHFEHWPYTKKLNDDNTPTTTGVNDYSDYVDNKNESGGDLIDGNDDGKRGNCP